MTTADLTLPLSDDVDVQTDELTPDTTLSSCLHSLTRYETGQAFTIVKVWFGSMAATYLPLLIAALLGPVSALKASDGVNLPFLRDWDIAFAFIISFPLLVCLIITDHAVLTSSLRRIQIDGILQLPRETAAALNASWRCRFRRLNRIAYGVGILVGALVVVGNYVAYTSSDVGYWVARHGHLLPAGYVFMYAIFLFYTLVPIYVLRSTEMTRYLKCLVSEAEFHMLPFHPDRCGGLRPVGRLGLRNQYVLTIFGLNVVLLFIFAFKFLKVSAPLEALFAAAAVAYVVVGPIVFMGPLLSFRAGMVRTKAKLMSEIAARLRVELKRLRKQLPSGELSKADEELIDRLRKLGSVIEELPVWPFDASTLRKFLTAYVAPLVGAAAYPIARALFSSLAGWFAPHS